MKLNPLFFRVFAVFLLVFCISGHVHSQNSKKVKQLKDQKTQLQKNLKKSQQDLAKTGKEVKNGQSYLHHIDRQLEDRLEHIQTMEVELENLEKEMTLLRSDIQSLDEELAQKKQKYIRALRFSYQFPKVHNTLVFVLSAKNLTQMYRRARYAREYAVYQHDLGRQIQQKQGQLMDAQNSLLATKSHKSVVLQEIMRQRRKLNNQQVRQQQYIRNLKKREEDLRTKVLKQQKELAALDQKIDALIAQEIEQARKRAEAEAQRKAAAKKRVAQSKKNGSSGKSGAASAKGEASASTWTTAEDRKLNGTFAQNKGRLPVPI